MSCSRPYATLFRESEEEAASSYKQGMAAEGSVLRHRGILTSSGNFHLLSLFYS